MYDPQLGAWRKVASLPKAHRYNATLLKTGEVLVVGDDNFSAGVPSAFLFNEQTGEWAETAPPAIKRYSATVTALRSGDALMIGGYNGGCCSGPSGTFRDVEFYDRARNVWLPARPMTHSRMLHTATVLPSGQILVVGGTQRDPVVPRYDVELFNPMTNTWSEVARLQTPRYAHTATLLPSGKVLVVGGFSGLAGGQNVAVASAEIYDPVNDLWTTAAAPQAMRGRHTATLLPSGEVLIAGGEHNGEPLDSVEVFDSTTGAWKTVSRMAVKRTQHIAALLPDDTVLVAGGISDGNRDVRGAELLDLVRKPLAPPVITAPSNAIFVTAKPGDANAILHFPLPAISADSRPDQLVCSPPPGSRFPLGTTVVNCSVTNVHGLSASTRFALTLWDVCLRDDESGDTLLFNSLNGDYALRRCGERIFTLTGRGRIEREQCETRLTDGKVSASFDRCPIAPKNRGQATIKLDPVSPAISIKDNDITNSKPCL
jgi:N-acetylneuraminic acid mutarotase